MNLPRGLARTLRLLRDPNRFGWPGAVGAALLASAAAFHFSVLLPEREHLDELRTASVAAAAARRESAEQAEEGAVTGRLARFHEAFPAATDLPDWFDRLFAVAQTHAMSLDQGEYKLTRNAAGRLARIEITLPVRASYPQVRGFVAALRSEMPALALDHIRFQRQKVGDGSLDVTIRLALYVEPGP